MVAFQVAPIGGVGTTARLTSPPGGKPDPLSTQSTSANRGEAETRVRAGESWRDIFQRLGAMLDSTIFSNNGLSGQLGNLPAPVPGKFLRARAAPGSTEAQIDYLVKEDEAYSIIINNDLMQVLPRSADPLVLERMRADPSRASLFTATDAIGLPETLALQLTQIFGGDVDFHRDLHLGYRCSIVYEMRYRNGHITESGMRILAAEFFIGEKRLSAYYFNDTNGRPGYFNETGVTTRKVFRRSPIEFSRITSDYTLARFHPILGIWRAHRGVDYAAPMGTRVMAIADGVVEYAGVRGDYGNLIVLRHLENRYLTYYAHLDSFAPGLAAGNRVAQGEVIGFVGMTGLVTGPHLHFEFHMLDDSGAWVPVSPPDTLISEVVAARGFVEAVRDYQDRFRLAEKSNFVTLD